MRDALQHARRYFARPAFSFVQWKEEGEVLAWASGQTIAFREEVLHVMKHLAPDGLPPFAAIVMVLAACRNGWNRGLEEMGSFRLVGDLVRSDWVENILRGLETVHGLDVSFRGTLQGKALIAEVVFEHTHWRLDPDHSAAVVDVFEKGSWNDILTESSSGKLKTGDLRPMLEALLIGLPHVSDTTLKNRRDTGLNELVEPADPELFPQIRARQMIAALRNDDELSGVGRIAHDLMAAVHVPHAVQRQAELPIGGVSDITNRGELDRLLVSELANDDLLLAVRVATNEAMYLRREAPPGTPPKMRAVLVDTNLRLWGIPRLFAASAALAMVATGDKHCAEYCCFRSHEKLIEEVDLLTREGLVKLLGSLSGGRHPADALGRFLEHIADLHADALLITSQDTWEDEAFRMAMREHAEQSFFVATVARTGLFQLHAVTANGTSMLNDAVIQLDHLNESEPEPSKPAKKQPLVRPEPDLKDFPAFFRADPCPLRAGYPSDVRTTWAVKDAKNEMVLMVTRDGMLLLFDEKSRPGIQLTDRLPSRRLRWSSHVIEEGITHAIVGTFQSQLFLLRIDVVNQGVSWIELEYGPEARGMQNESKSPRDTWRARGVFVADSMVVIVHRKHMNVLSMDTGEWLYSQETEEGLHWHNDRIFRTKHWHSSWYRATFNEESIHGHRIQEFDKISCFDVFERHGMDGVIGVSGNGTVIFTGSGHHESVGANIVESYHTPNGESLGLRLKARDRNQSTWTYRTVLDNQRLSPESLWWSSIDYGRLFDPVVRSFWTDNNTRRHFDDISITKTDKKLCLRRRGVALTLEFDQERKAIHWKVHEASKVNCTRVRVLNDVERPAGMRLRIKKALWSEAGEAFIDSRGLLHLKSNNPDIPELTISLLPWQPSGWTSDGRYFGDWRGLNGPEVVAVEDRAIYKEVIEPFLRPLS